MAENLEAAENKEASITAKEATEEFEIRNVKSLSEEEIQKLVALAVPKPTARELLWNKLREASEQGTPPAGHEDLQEHAALQVVLLQLDAALTALGAMGQRPFSCDHETLYAGSVESPNNKVFTYQEFTNNALEQVREFEEYFEQQ